MIVLKVFLDTSNTVEILLKTYFPIVLELLQVSESDNEVEHNDSNDAISAMSDPTQTFGTISTVLMQYK